MTCERGSKLFMSSLQDLRSVGVEGSVTKTEVNEGVSAASLIRLFSRRQDSLACPENAGDW